MSPAPVSSSGHPAPTSSETTDEASLSAVQGGCQAAPITEVLADALRDGGVPVIGTLTPGGETMRVPDDGGDTLFTRAALSSSTPVKGIQAPEGEVWLQGGTSPGWTLEIEDPQSVALADDGAVFAIVRPKRLPGTPLSWVSFAASLVDGSVILGWGCDAAQGTESGDALERASFSGSFRLWNGTTPGGVPAHGGDSVPLAEFLDSLGLAAG